MDNYLYSVGRCPTLEYYAHSVGLHGVRVVFLLQWFIFIFYYNVFVYCGMYLLYSVGHCPTLEYYAHSVGLHGVRVEFVFFITMVMFIFYYNVFLLRCFYIMYYVARGNLKIYESCYAMLSPFVS